MIECETQGVEVIGFRPIRESQRYDSGGGIDVVVDPDSARVFRGFARMGIVECTLLIIIIIINLRLQHSIQSGKNDLP
jgi:hypothetical protein